MSKVAVITGGSQGLGLAFAQNLAAQGYELVLIARNKAKLDDAVKLVEKGGGKALALSADISKPGDMDKAAARVKEKYDSVSFLINNAGIFTTEILENIGTEQIKRDLDTSLFGTIICTRSFLPLMETGGKILFVSSGFGLMGAAGYSVYCAAKAGMINFAEALKRELHSRNISIYVSVPSDIDTPAFREEAKNMPEWLSVAAARAKPQSADIVAKKVLNKCRGSRFYIFSDGGVFLLYLLTKLLPKGLLDKILNGMFPKP